MASIRVSAKVRRAVAERARFCCEYCWSQESYATQSFSVEHILARYHGGKNHLDNLALACQGCNNHKHTKLKGLDPATGQLTRLFHPRHDRWQDHFTWNEDFSIMIGLTDIGRATIAELQINRSGLVNLRQAFYLLGKHPPKAMQDDLMPNI
jgi:HNH endonuclease